MGIDWGVGQTKPKLFEMQTGEDSVPKEVEVEKMLMDHLCSCGFVVKERTGVHGIDIVAERDGQVHFIEVQGNVGRKGRSFEVKQKRNHAHRVVGQVCSRLHTNPEARLGIAFPEDEFYRRKVDEMKIAFGRLHMTVYFLKANGEVEEIRYGQA